MSLVLKSNSTYVGRSELLPTELAPLPIGASYYFDFMKNLFVGYTNSGVQAKNTKPSNNFAVTNATTINIDGDIEYSSDRYFKNRKPLGFLANSDSNPAIASTLDLKNAAWTTSNITVDNRIGGDYAGTHRVAASAGTNLKASISQQITTGYIRACLYAFVQKGTARYLMIESTGNKNAFAVFDLLLGVVTNIGNVVSNARVIPRGKYLQCSFGTTNTDALNGSVKYSIVTSAKAIPDDLFTYNGTETMYIGAVSVDRSTEIARMPAIASQGARAITPLQKVTVQNSITIFVKALMPETYVQVTQARVLEIGTDGGSMAVGFNTLASPDFPHYLYLAQSNGNLDTAQTRVVNTPDVLWESNEILNIAVCIKGNVITVVCKGTVIEYVHPSLPENWTLSTTRIGLTSDLIIQKYVQYHTAKTVDEMRDFMKTL